jgi:predicted N-acyltransferase
MTSQPRPRDAHSVALYSSAREITSAEWASLSTGVDARLDPAWFAVIERAVVNAEPLYLCLRQNDTLRTIAPCLVGFEDDNGFATYRATDVLLRPEEVRGPDVPGLARDELRRLAPALRALRPLRTLTVVVPFSRYAPVNELLSLGGEAFARLVAELDDLAVKREASLWAILGIADDSPLLDAARQHGFRPALLSADAVLEARWSSFDEYVMALPRNRRTMVRKERRAAAARYTIAPEPHVDAIIPALDQLDASHRAKYGRRRGGPLPIAPLARAFGDDSRILGARRSGRLIAYTMLLRRSDVVQVFGYSANHAVRERNDFLWSNMAMYAPIAHAIAEGGAKVRWGPTNYQAKLLRGPLLERTWGLYRPLEPALEAALNSYLGPFNKLQEAHYGCLQRYSV